MSAEERLEVSKRMSRYWQMRRAQARALEAAASAAGGAAAAASSKAG